MAACGTHVQRRWLRRILLIILLVWPSITLADVGVPVGESPFGFDYDRLYRRAVLTGEVSNWPSTGPIFHNDFHSVFDYPISPALDLMSQLRDDRVRLFMVPSERYRTSDGFRGQDYFSLVGGAHFEPSAHFGAMVLFDLDRERALDPDYTGKKWRGLAGDIETAMIYYRNGGLNLGLGRQRVYWGPQPVNLLLSETAEPLDMITASFRKGRVQFSFLMARLDGSRPDSLDYVRFPQASFNDNRYLVGHRLDITPFRTFRIGLFETSLYGGEGRPPELYYLNPLQFFHTVQLNEGMDDNTILGLDFTWLPHAGYALYGQLLIDDIQVDNEVQSDQEPNEFGLMAGLFRVGRAGSLEPDVKLEYVRITNRTYHQVLPRNRYLYRNKLLGHPLGPDADSVSLSVRFWPSENLSTAIETGYSRHGEGSIYDPWDEPWMDVQGDYSERFPTGVVQKGIFVAGRIEGYVPIDGYWSDHLFFQICGGYGSFENYHNVAAGDQSTTWLTLSLSWLGGLELGLGD